MFNLTKTVFDAAPSSLTSESRIILQQFQDIQSWLAFAGFVLLIVAVGCIYMVRLWPVFRRLLCRKRKAERDRFAATELEELPSTSTTV